MRADVTEVFLSLNNNYGRGIHKRALAAFLESTDFLYRGKVWNVIGLVEHKNLWENSPYGFTMKLKKASLK